MFPSGLGLRFRAQQMSCHSQGMPPQLRDQGIGANPSTSMPLGLEQKEWCVGARGVRKGTWQTPFGRRSAERGRAPYTKILSIALRPLTTFPWQHLGARGSFSWLNCTPKQHLTLSFTKNLTLYAISLRIQPVTNIFDLFTSIFIFVTQNHQISTKTD